MKDEERECKGTSPRFLAEDVLWGSRGEGREGDRRQESEVRNLESETTALPKTGQPGNRIPIIFARNRSSLLLPQEFYFRDSSDKPRLRSKYLHRGYPNATPAGRHAI